MDVPLILISVDSALIYSRSRIYQYFMIQYVSLTNMHRKLSYTGINTCIIAFIFSKNKKNKEILIISEA